MQSAKKPKVLSSSTIKKGDTHSFSIDVTADLVQRFAELSGDYNSLHVDADYANSVGFKGAVAHGALQTAWVSQTVGMWLIGQKCLIHKIISDYKTPLVYPCVVKVKGHIESWSQEFGAGRVIVTIENDRTSELFSEHQIDVSHHAESKVTSSQSTGNLEGKQKSHPPSSTRRQILVTGGTGGMMRQVVIHLSKSYDLILTGRNTQALEKLSSDCSPGKHTVVPMDLLSLDSFNHGESSLQNLWGVIHGASLPIFQKSLTEIQARRLQDEWAVTATATVQLARLLTQNARDGGRLIVIGSESTKKLNTFLYSKIPLYGLGKRFLTETCQALSEELASKRITVNVVHPGPVAAGMNAGLSPASLKMLAAENPMKRLCDINDLISALHYFLSDDSGYVSGQELYLTGGR